MVKKIKLTDDIVASLPFQRRGRHSTGALKSEGWQSVSLRQGRERI